MALTLTSKAGAVVPAGDRLPAVPQFGARANTLRFLTLALDTAVTDKLFPITGTRIKVVSASSLSAGITVKFQDQSVAGLPMSKGSGIRGLHFDQLYLTWAAQPGATITLLVAVEATDRIELDDPAEDYTSVSVAKSATLATVADVACANTAKTQLLAADATRRTALIRVPATAATSVRIGDTNVAAARGLEVQPGEQITLETTAAIFLRNDSGGAINVSITTVND